MAVLRVSIIFTLGAFVLVANSALSFLPFIGLKTDLPKQIIYVEAILSVVSCSLFLIGSSIAFWECLKATTGSGGYFPWEYEDYSPIESQESEAERGAYFKEAEEDEKSLVVPQAHYLHHPNISLELLSQMEKEECAKQTEQLPAMPRTHHLHQLHSTHESLFKHTELENGPLSRPSSPPPPFQSRAPSRSQSPSPPYRSQPVSRSQSPSPPYRSRPPSRSHSPSRPSHSRAPSRAQSPPPAYSEAMEHEHPSWKHAFSAHGFHEMYCNLGLVASAIFLVSSLIYCMTALASFITILSIGEVFRAIRYPQLVAGSGFTIGSALLLAKTQKDTTGHWWKPALRRLAWHVNLWNLIGSAGFVFCAYFGLLAHVHWSDFQFNCSYLWGSWAFLFGSMIQWWKARHKMKIVKRHEAKKAAAKRKLRITPKLDL